MATILSDAARDWIEEWSGDLRPFYDSWNAWNGAPSMTASLQTVSMLVGLAQSVGGACLDLGSGFSSFALRSSGARAVTVDHDTHWLERTGRFLDRNRVPRGVMLRNIEHLRAQYSVVFYDFGDMKARIESLSRAYDRVEPGGYIVVDDMHVGGLRKAAFGIRDKYSLRPVSYDEIRELTLDEYGRWSTIMQKDEP